MQYHTCMPVATLALIAISIDVVVGQSSQISTDPKAPRTVTDAGALQGVYLKDGKVSGYLGVPYAEALTPARRFLPSTQVQPWVGTLTATTAGAGCPQAGSAAGSVTGVEDCLKLDVYVPTGAHNASVAVYVHGGGLIQGTDATYDAAALAEDYGVVVICIQYRLGVLGFFQHEALAAQSNGALGGMNGILDQILALEFVKRNIEAFGGSSERVTVWGESAGAQSVCALVAAPPAAGLFSQAIIESGQCVDKGYSGWAPGNVSEGLAAGQHFLAAVGAADIAALRKLSLTTLVHAPYGVTPSGAWPPIYYNDNATFTDAASPRALWTAGKLNAKRLLVGFNTADGMVGWPFANYGEVNHTMTTAQVLTTLSKAFGPMHAEAVLQQYPLSQYGRPDAAVLAAYRDEALACPVYRMAGWASSAGVTTFTYLIGSPLVSGEFIWPTSYFPHGLELGALFDFTNLTFVPLFMTEETGRRLRNYWLEFVDGGTPVDPGGVAWPQFNGSATSESISPYMYIGPTIAVDGSPGDQLPLPDAARCAFWASIRATLDSPVDV
eukprot:m.48109 g.48109  ORF g.48109 m.48109 type:complete len:553 (+) comp8898_c0_seq1:92-1750(+)